MVQEWLKQSRYGPTGNPAVRVPSAVFEKILDMLEHTSGQVGSGYALPPADAARELLPRVRFLADESASPSSAGRLPYALPSGLAVGTVHLNRLIEDVAVYWIARRSRLRKPLLRRYWAPTLLGDQHPHHTFRPHDKEKRTTRARTRRNDAESFSRMKVCVRNALRVFAALCAHCCMTTLLTLTVTC